MKRPISSAYHHSFAQTATKLLVILGLSLLLMLLWSAPVALAEEWLNVLTCKGLICVHL